MVINVPEKNLKSTSDSNLNVEDSDIVNTESLVFREYIHTKKSQVYFPLMEPKCTKIFAFFFANGHYLHGHY